MRFLNLFLKAGVAIVMTTYATCLINDVTAIDYTETENGGSISIIGHSVNLKENIASDFMEAYVRAEEQATKWLPSKIRYAVEQLSELFNGA